MALLEPFDLQNLFVDKLIGTGGQEAVIFFFIALAVVSVMAARFRMPGMVYTIIVILLVGVFGTIEGFRTSGVMLFVYTIALMGIVIVIVKSFSRAASQ